MIVGGIAFLGMLTEWLLPQLNKDSADFILQMDGAPNHFILQMDGAPNHFTLQMDGAPNHFILQMDEAPNHFILQMDGAPNHFHRHVREFLNQHLPQRWIGRGTDDDQMLLAWPPPSPDATPCDFFLWGCVKDQVYVPPLPASIPEHESEPPLKPSPLTCYKQFGTNSIIVLMFVESQRVHI